MLFVLKFVHEAVPNSMFGKVRTVCCVFWLGVEYEIRNVCLMPFIQLGYVFSMINGLYEIYLNLGLDSRFSILWV